MRLGPGLLYEGRTLQGARPKLADFCSATMAEFYSAVDNGHKDRELSGVTVIASPWHPDPITSAVVEAFLALGYAIEDAGADVYGYPICDGNHSRHDALRSYARIESTLDRFRSP